MRYPPCLERSVPVQDTADRASDVIVTISFDPGTLHTFRIRVPTAEVSRLLDVTRVTALSLPRTLSSNCHASCRSRRHTFYVRAEEAGVTVSMRVMSAGDGYKYLLRTAVSGHAKLPIGGHGTAH